MKLGPPPLDQTREATRRAAQQLESFLVKQLLVTSGAFKGREGVAGSSLTHDLFADTLAQVVSQSGGLGLAPLIEQSLGQQPTSAWPESAGEGELDAVVTSGFGARRDPFSGERSTHTGVDLGAPEGTPIPAARDGVVVAAGPRGGYGNAIEISHDDGTTTLYGHASEVTVAPGQAVHAGDTIGLVGQTGRSTGPHLHLEVRRGGHFVDPGIALKSYRLRAEKVGGGEP